MKRRSRATEEEFSLFPFLAVLLCTMGTLALIFVLVAQKTGGADATTRNDANPLEFDNSLALNGSAARGEIVDSQTLTNALGAQTPKAFAEVDSLAEEAEEDAEQLAAYERALAKTNAASLEEVQNESESLEWFADELDAIREQTADAFNEERARLANAEAALAELRKKAALARTKYDALVNKNDAQSQDAEKLKTRLDALNAEILTLQTETKQLREKAKDVKRSYAIAPYQGKKGTFRRPIYVECTANGVVLMPENVKFDDMDFLLARYPGNPFDSALRAVAHRYLLQNGEKNAKGETIEPYPLLIVRPGGAEYFYAAVRALASWGDVYGYEFVDEDQPLEYPTRDPQIGQIAQEQANFARNRLQAQLAAAIEEERTRATIQRITSIASGSGANGLGGEGGSGAVNGGNGGSGGTSSLQARLGTDVRVGAARSQGTSARQLESPTFAGAATTNGTQASTGGTPNAPTGNNAGVPIVAGERDLASPPSTAQYVGQYAQYVTPTGGGTSHVGSGTTESNVGAAGAAAGVAQSAQAQTEAGSTTQYVSNAAAPGQASQQGQTLTEASASAGSRAANAPEYMKRFIDPSQPIGNGASPVEYGKTLGNTAYAANASGPSTSGQDAPSSSQAEGNVSQETPRAVKRELPQGAFSVTEEALRPATSGNERGITLRCGANGYVFPRQPGLRADATVRADASRDRAEVEKELEDAVALCVKSWGGAGRNHYWAPFLRVEVQPGGEEEYRKLVEFCNRQGLGVVPVAPSQPK